jgi:hypothetical protein
MKSLELALRPLMKEVEQHRSSRKFKREAYPDKVWSKAGELAVIYGAQAVSQATSLDSRKIRQLTQELADATVETSGPTFVEWTAAPPDGPGLECLLELESGERKMKVQVRLDFSQLSKMTQDFWSR